MGNEGVAARPMLRRFDLSGKVALVTGASRGIGAGLALALAGAGVDLALVARGKESLGNTAGQARELGRRALVVPADLTLVEEIRRMVGQVVAEYGRIDVLVNAAGAQVRKPMLEVTEEDWDRVIAIGPGYFHTEMTRRLYEDPEKHQWVISRTPMSRWGEIDDLAGAVVFLASDASDFITGELINVDGGWLAS